MYEKLVGDLRYCDKGDCNGCRRYTKDTRFCNALLREAADAIEELSKRIDRAVELYNRGVERSAMYEALVGIAPDPPKEEAPTGPYDLLYEEGGANTT